MGKTLPFVLEYLNVAFGQGLLGQTGSLSLWAGQPQHWASWLVSLAVGSFSLFAFLCLLTVHPVPGISWKFRSLFFTPESFPSRKQALHPVAFKWICNVSLLFISLFWRILNQYTPNVHSVRFLVLDIIPFLVTILTRMVNI